ncbi:restriction endonuclease subunit S [Desulfoluna spongiiphila]|uniref:restriction endonuclease subunit S n=1 Tax=Desulfoluna spongiiphila TaxID=419481 RepID=UPI0015875056|nr:restriction endonuclease subunit S [Desulfoluna spongiiphila]
MEFIDSIPRYWELTKFKYVVDFQEGPGILAKDFFDSGVPLLRIQNIKENYVTDDYKTFLDPNTANNKWKQFKVQFGDVIISCSASTGLVSEVDSCTVGAIPYTGLIRLRPKPNCIVKDFVKYFVKSEAYHEQIRILQTGSTIQHYGPIHLNQISISMPDLAGQISIAAFLDYETAKIDTLIEKQQTLIALLKEKRQAVISHAVTKGLDPGVPMRDSGVEWLGEVPEHWVVCKLKYIAKLESGHTPSRRIAEYWQNCTIPWFTLADVWQLRDGRQVYVKETKEKVSEIGLANSSARLLPASTVILSRTASVGFSGIMSVDMATTQDFANWVCGQKIRPLFLYYILKAMKNDLSRLTMGSTHKTIYMPDIEAFTIALPPLEEQAMIVEHITKKIEHFDLIIDKSEQVVTTLTERRTALISTAVTGKIDVRNWKAPAQAQTNTVNAA